MRNRCKVAVTLAFLVSMMSGQSFEAFHLKSGMTPEEVSRAYPTYDFRWVSQTGLASRSAMLVREKEYDIFASLLFCNNSLVGLTRSIDPDTDFLRYLNERLTEFGQPQVSIRRDAWTGPGGGDIERVDFTWVHNQVRYTLSFNPEGRTGEGELRYLRQASVAFFTLTSPCMTKK